MEPNGAFGFLGRLEMAEQILIGQTCHVASDRSDIGSASDSTEEGEETRKASKLETREGTRTVNGGISPTLRQALLFPTCGTGRVM